MDHVFEHINLQECPQCDGPALIQEEDGWCVYVECLDCGCHSAELTYKNEGERMAAAQSVADLWNMGKVIKSCVGE